MAIGSILVAFGMAYWAHISFAPLAVGGLLRWRYEQAAKPSRSIDHLAWRGLIVCCRLRTIELW
jgi:hypothetical protein